MGIPCDILKLQEYNFNKKFNLKCGEEGAYLIGGAGAIIQENTNNNCTLNFIKQIYY